MSWPLKYRPRQLEDLALTDVKAELLRLIGQVGQKDQKGQKEDRQDFPQAFLFAGPKGSGKTSTSRIISVLLNDNLDAEEIDKIFLGNSFIINEMDAASNRRIDDIRALQEKISLPPALGKKSIYILDEAHMLTKEAFNALLKVLEEPPTHVVFILATTELHKIPETIVSRCNVINFRKAEPEELRVVLTKILKAEKKEIEPEALNQVIARSGGSFRDAVKLLETVSRGVKKITLEQVSALGDPKLNHKLMNLIEAVLNKDEIRVVRIIGEFRTQATDVDFVYQELLSFLHQDLLLSMGVGVGGMGKARFSPKISLFLLGHLQDLPKKENGLIPFLSLEIKLLELIFKSKNQTQKGKATPTAVPVAVSQNVKKNPPELKNETSGEFGNFDEATAAKDSFDRILHSRPITQPIVLPITQSMTQPIVISTPHSESFKSDNLVNPAEINYVNLCEVWDDFLQALEAQNLTLAAILKSSKLMSDASGITKIGVFYKFHKVQLEQQRLLSILQACGQKVAGGVPKFEFILLSENEKQANFAQAPKKDQFQPIAHGLEQDVTEALL